MNAALIEAAKDPRDSLICIQMFNWVSFLTMVLRATTGTFQWQITFRFTSIKSTHIFSADISEQYEVFEKWVQASWTETILCVNWCFTVECVLGQCGLQTDECHSKILH